MIVQAYRITQKRYAHCAFDGEGARLYGGRWNSPGVPMIYTASSLSLATLELLVHVEDASTIFGRYVAIPINFDEALVERVEPQDLPENWDSRQPLAASQQYGDRWVARASSPVLAVPSAVTHGEENYLLNPEHPDFARISPGSGSAKLKDSSRTRD